MRLLGKIRKAVSGAAKKAKSGVKKSIRRNFNAGHAEKLAMRSTLSKVKRSKKPKTVSAGLNRVSAAGKKARAGVRAKQAGVGLAAGAASVGAAYAATRKYKNPKNGKKK